MIVNNEETLFKAEKIIADAKILAYDIETTGLNVRRDKIIGYGVSDEEGRAFYVEYGSEFFDRLLNALNRGTPLLAFNAYFDLQFTLEFTGIDLWDNLHCDVLLLKHTCDEDYPLDLKGIGKKIFGLDATVEQEEMKASIKANGGTPTEFYKADLEVLAKYCIKDCQLTMDLYKHYSKQLKKDNLEKFFYTDEVMPLQKEVTRFMQCKGVPVDLIAITAAQSEITADIEMLEADIRNQISPLITPFEEYFLNKKYPLKRGGLIAEQIALDLEKDHKVLLPRTGSGKVTTSKKTLGEYFPEDTRVLWLNNKLSVLNNSMELQRRLHKRISGEDAFNLQSKHHLKKLFFEYLKLTPISKTEKGNPQVDEKTISHYANEYEWCKQLSTYNKLNKIKSTYIDRILEKQEDGIFYPAFFQHRTVSGRYGSDIQQLPRPTNDPSLPDIVKKYRNEIRKWFISGSTHNFIDADYESLEPHIFAHVSGDKKLQEIFHKGHDFYSTIAIATEGLVGVSADKKADNYLGSVDKAKRQLAKAYSLGIPYGMGAYALSMNIKVPQEVAGQLIDGYLSGFPQLKQWMKNSEKALEEKGKITTPMGRVRRFPLGATFYRMHGEILRDGLELWKKFHKRENGRNICLYPSEYAQMKFKASVVKKAMNNIKNVQIQATAASVTNRACIAINRYMKENNIDGYVCLQIHDQIVVRVGKEFAELMQKKVEEIMTSVVVLDVPLKAPAEIAINLYEGH